jgi:predicted protein tyrosine phosphatase
MIEVYSKLFVGNEYDYYSIVSRDSGWAVVHACKEPFHRQALGYTGRAIAKTHPEYLVARRGNRLILNIVDTDNPQFYSRDMIKQSLDFVDEMRTEEMKVLIHCNQGESRAPSIALLYLATRLKALPMDSFEVAEKQFRILYSRYSPKFGIREHIRQNWQYYYDQGNIA